MEPKVQRFHVESRPLHFKIPRATFLKVLLMKNHPLTIRSIEKFRKKSNRLVTILKQVEWYSLRAMEVLYFLYTNVYYQGVTTYFRKQKNELVLIDFSDICSLEDSKTEVKSNNCFIMSCPTVTTASAEIYDLWFKFVGFQDFNEHKQNT